MFAAVLSDREQILIVRRGRAAHPVEIVLAERLLKHTDRLEEPVCDLDRFSLA